MKKQNFRPDTCECAFEVNIDEQTGTMSVSEVFIACDVHKPAMDLKYYESVLREGNKNKVVSEEKICKEINAYKADINTKTFISAMKDNHYKNNCIATVESDHSVPADKIVWSFDEQRNLSLSHPNLTQEQIKESIDKVSE